MIEFITWIEIPVRVTAEYQPEEPASRHYPGCPAAMGIEEIEIMIDEKTSAKNLTHLTNYILERYMNDMEVEAWEHK